MQNGERGMKNGASPCDVVAPAGRARHSMRAVVPQRSNQYSTMFGGGQRTARPTRYGASWKRRMKNAECLLHAPYVLHSPTFCFLHSAFPIPPRSTFCVLHSPPPPLLRCLLAGPHVKYGGTRRPECPPNQLNEPAEQADTVPLCPDHRISGRHVFTGPFPRNY